MSPGSEAMVRVPPCTTESTAPVRPGIAPHTSTPRRLSTVSTSCPGSVSGRGPKTRACAPKAAAQVVTLAACCQGDPCRGVVVADERTVRLDDHVEQDVAQACE